MDNKDKGSWRDSPPDYGKWYTAYKRFIKYAKNGIWAYLFEVMGKDTKLKKCIVMIDSSYIKIHMHATGKKIKTKILVAQNGLHSKIHLVVNGHGMPIDLIVTDRSRANCKKAKSYSFNQEYQCKVSIGNPNLRYK